jgi:hypothetical protein
MYLYSGFSLQIQSQLELPEFLPGAGEADVTIRFGSVCETGTEATIHDERVFHATTGAFHIREGREIIVDLLPDANAGSVRTLLAGRFFGYLLRQRGYLALHASAVAVCGKAVLFLGESGAGKSTTAAAFHPRGHAVLADDVAAVRLTEAGPELQPAWPGLRLMDDSREALGDEAPAEFLGVKHFYRFERPASSGAVPLKSIYVLDYDSGEGDCVHSSALSGLEAVAWLNTHSLLRSWHSGHELRQMNLDRAAAVAAVTPVRRLIRPRSLKSLPTLVDLVESEVMDSTVTPADSAENFDCRSYNLAADEHR